MYTKNLLEITGISRDTLRYWRQRGLITPQRNPANNYLTYTTKDIERIALIKEAQMLGFTLSEIALLLNCMHGAPCKHQALLPKLELHYDALTEKITALQKMRRRIKKTITDFRARDCTKHPTDLHLT